MLSRRASRRIPQWCKTPEEGASGSCSQWHQSRRFHPVELRNLKMASVPAWPNLHRNAASLKWCNMVREVFSWSLWFVRYGCQRRRRRKVGNIEISLHVGAPSLGSKVSYMRCSVLASSWEASFASFRSCSRVARLFVCITAYNHCYPFIDSTTVLSDISVTTTQ